MPKRARASDAWDPPKTDKNEAQSLVAGIVVGFKWQRERPSSPIAKALTQLCRERFGDQAALIGFGTHTSTVAAASDWGGDMEIKHVQPSHRESYERLCHGANIPRFLLDLGQHKALRRRLLEPRLERFIRVIYRPDTELMSHYADASLPQQFDAFVWFDETSAITPLGMDHPRSGAPDTTRSVCRPMAA